MNKVAITTIVIVAMFTFFAISANSAFSAEMMFEAQIASIETLIDKNGNEYTKAIVNVDETIEGVKFSIGRALMAFGNLSDDLAAYNAGQTVKAVVQERTFQGSTYYNVLAFPKKSE